MTEKSISELIKELACDESKTKSNVHSTTQDSVLLLSKSSAVRAKHPIHNPKKKIYANDFTHSHRKRINHEL